jgi:thiamine pyrophosphate-dependent acetolactate synthase large subunit-like protein
MGFALPAAIELRWNAKREVVAIIGTGFPNDNSRIRTIFQTKVPVKIVIEQ